jgi:hypothetical protein
MNRKEFNKIAENLLIPSIGYSFKELGVEKFDLKLDSVFFNLAYEKYESKRIDIKKNVMKNPDRKIDRHKIAALLYVALVELAVERNFRDFSGYFKGKHPSNKDFLFAFVHDFAFNAALGVVESFIVSDWEKDKKYRKHVEKEGIVTQSEVYKECTVKEFIFAQKEGKLSAILIANILYLIEDISEFKFQTLKY